MDIPPRATENAFARLRRINEGGNRKRFLRISVEGGGCSGFQYGFALADRIEEDDFVLSGGGERILVDPVSRELLAGAVVDYSEDLVASRFTIDNPNAVSSCGCGTSFSL